MTEPHKPSFSEIEAAAERRFDEMQAFQAKQLARELGTLNVDDRSKQYPIDDEQKLKAAVNLALTKARRCERLNDAKDAQILEQKKEIRWLKRLYVPIMSIVTAFIVKALEVCFLEHLWK